MRSGASGISSGTGYAFGFLTNKLFLSMLNTLTMPGTFWFYSAVALIGALVLYFVLPETEGRTLMEIERHFAGHKRMEDDSMTDVGGQIKAKQQQDIIREVPLTTVCVNDGERISNGLQKHLVQRRRFSTSDPNVEPRSEITRL